MISGGWNGAEPGASDGVGRGDEADATAYTIAETGAVFGTNATRDERILDDGLGAALGAWDGGDALRGEVLAEGIGHRADDLSGSGRKSQKEGGKRQEKDSQQGVVDVFPSAPNSFLIK